MWTRRYLLTATLAASAALAPGRLCSAANGTFRIGYQKNGILAVAKDRGTIEAGLKPLPTAFTGSGLIPRPIRIADIVWTPPGGGIASNG